MQRWGEKRYHSLDYEMKQLYGEKLYKVTLDGGFSCPNRDGKVGTGGCIFCSPQGSGDFAGNRTLSIRQQLANGKTELQKKRPIQSYIAYFQAFTNTYGPVEKLEQLYTEALEDPDVKILSIATRPDCLDSDVLELLSRLRRKKPIWVELGLQTIHPNTAAYIRRGYDLETFNHAVANLRAIGITVIVHTILYLPGETKEQMFETIEYLNTLDIQGIKLQLLHILKDTDLASDFEQKSFLCPDMPEYIETLSECITRLRPDIVIHRLTGDGPKDLLIAPLWTSQKRTVLNNLHRFLKEQDLWQGKEYRKYE